MEERGVVISASGGSARIRMTVSEGCGGCRQAGQCHPEGAAERVLEVHDPVGVAAGQEVLVRLPSRGVWLSMLLVYVFPLVMLFTGAWLGFLVGGDVLSALGALAMLGGSFGLLRAARPFYEHRVALRPVIVHVLAENGVEKMAGRVRFPSVDA